MIGHCDWLAGNLRWSGDALLVEHDWDSMTADSEAVPVGFAAALYSTVSADKLATVEDTERFLVAYCHARGRQFSVDEYERSWAAGVWTKAYGGNAFGGRSAGDRVHPLNPLAFACLRGSQRRPSILAPLETSLPIGSHRCETPPALHGLWLWFRYS